MRIGAIDVHPLIDGVGREFAGEIISRFSDPDAWRAHPEAFGHDGRWEFPVGGFLVRAGARVIVVDAGVGPMDDGDYAGGGLIDRLADHGVSPRSVTDVVFTHLHFDHIGWASVDGIPTFPGAVHRVHRADWAHFVEGPGARADVLEKLRPIEPLLERFDADVELVDGVALRWMPGHTPGSTVVELSSEGSRALLLGDVVHSPVQLAERDWTVVWDRDPLAASSARNRLADEAAARGDLVVAAHLPGQRFGRIVVEDGARRFVPLEPEPPRAQPSPGRP
ncbi:MBL fold metallo-hydrolase [Agromyces sp. NPDC060279]|uniref:MBL fold metallo-hydrolase n=1 Tax=Agromyces sp. NPDC060279 TaxID=3347092 RepID=UPI003663738C